MIKQVRFLLALLFFMVGVLLVAAAKFITMFMGINATILDFFLYMANVISLGLGFYVVNIGARVLKKKTFILLGLFVIAINGLCIFNYLT